jgi:hypothetical protein
MLSPTLKSLKLENIPSLVELPSSFQNLNQLKELSITYCRNLETLPTGINLKSLNYLCFKGCSQLRSFPEISTNISVLNLEETGIEEVPWQIENFFNLTKLTMRSCSKLKCLSLNIPKMKTLWDVDFSDCAALTVVNLSGYPSDTLSEEEDDSLDPFLDFRGCFSLDPETVLHQESVIFNSMAFPGEQVPSYFTYRTTGTSTILPNIPLLPTQLSQPFFRFRVCAVATAFNIVSIQVNSRFTGRFGNSFDFFGEGHELMEIRKGDMLIFDCRIPFNEDNALLARGDYDHVDMNIHISGDSESTFELKGWGIRLLEDCSSVENRLVNPTHAYTPVQGLVNEIEHNEDSGDNNVETKRSAKRMRIT